MSWRSTAKSPLSHTSLVAIQYSPFFSPLPFLIAGAENETRSTRVGSIILPTPVTRFEGEISTSSTCESSDGE